MELQRSFYLKTLEVAGDNFTSTVLDDNASEAINTGSAPFTGSFSPQGSLNDFQGFMSARRLDTFYN